MEFFPSPLCRGSNSGYKQLRFPSPGKTGENWPAAAGEGKGEGEMGMDEGVGGGGGVEWRCIQSN